MIGDVGTSKVMVRNLGKAIEADRNAAYKNKSMQVSIRRPITAEKRPIASAPWATLAW